MSVDPTLQYCNCGYCFRPTLFMKLGMLVRGGYVFVCPVCQSRLRLRLIHHVVKVDTEVNNGRFELWKRG